MKSTVSWHSRFLQNGTASCGLPQLLKAARTLKMATLAGASPQPLRDKHIALLCESGESAMTAAFESAAIAVGGEVARFQPRPYRLNDPAHAKEVAGILGLLYDAIAYVGVAPSAIHDIAREGAVPLLWDWEHAVDAIAGLMTLCEHSDRPLQEIKLCLSGDARTPAGDAWLQAAAASGLEVRIAGPREWWPQPNRLRRVIWLSLASGGHLQLLESQTEAGNGSDFIYDTRTSQSGAGRSGLSIAASAARPAAALGSEHAVNRKYALQALLCGCTVEHMHSL